MDNDMNPDDLITEARPEPPRFSGKLTAVYPDGTVQYDGQIGLPSDFPLTEAELAEIVRESGGI